MLLARQSEPSAPRPCENRRTFLHAHGADDRAGKFRDEVHGMGVIRVPLEPVLHRGERADLLHEHRVPQPKRCLDLLIGTHDGKFIVDRIHVPEDYP